MQTSDVNFLHYHFTISKVCKLNFDAAGFGKRLQTFAHDDNLRAVFERVKRDMRHSQSALICNDSLIEERMAKPVDHCNQVFRMGKT